MEDRARMKMWTDLPPPKPSWETFKRMLPACENNPLVVKARWTRKNRTELSK